MSYIITTTNGNVLLTLADGTTNSSTGVTLIGKNYTNYGLAQNDNFVSLVENFAGTVPPNQLYTSILRGMLWYDTATDLIKVYDGTTFNTVGGHTGSATAPTAKHIGDQWWDTVHNQLRSWTGNTWQLVGPGYSSTQGVTGEVLVSALDSNSINRSFMETFVSNTLVSITSLDSFIPANVIPGFTTITAGINVASPYAIAANNASFASNINVGQAINANIINTNGINVLGNINTTEVNVLNSVHANVFYQNSAQVVSSVTQLAGPGISIASNGNAGPAIVATINNTGVISLTGGSGIVLSSPTGNIVVTNSGVTSITAGTGVNISNATGPVQLSIGQNVDVTSTPTFNGMHVSGHITPTANAAIDVGSSTYWARAIYGQSIVGNTYTGVTYSGNAFVGNVISATTYNGTTYNGTTFTGVTFNGNTFSGTATTAKYADLAENYLSDKSYDAGTVVTFGGSAEITMSTTFADVSVAGVISTKPAYLMNSELTAGLPVALRGRVPVKVIGAVRKGDLLVTSAIAGHAVSVGKDISAGPAIFAKALENKDAGEAGIIEAVII
ncbi:MAG TPA: hypothetical protein VFM18_19055 [Methanosarcina sp.]|nr:hypothetical protein [Methanosarcina sp.]